MSSKSLKSAAEAAGYAMVNPDDFAGEAVIVTRAEPPRQEQAAAAEPTATEPRERSKTWLSWESIGFPRSNAPACSGRNRAIVS